MLSKINNFYPTQNLGSVLELGCGFDWIFKRIRIQILKKNMITHDKEKGLYAEKSIYDPLSILWNALIKDQITEIAPYVRTKWN